MPIDPELLKQLVSTFKEELAEKLDVLSDGLLTLEKITEPDQRAEVVNAVFRAAHSIKGAARSVGVEDVGEIAHALETIFNDIRQQKKQLTPELNDICLKSIDKMQLAMNAYLNKQAVDFDVSAFCQRLQSAEIKPDDSTEKKTVDSSRQEIEPDKRRVEDDVIRVSVKDLVSVTALTDTLLGSCFALEQSTKNIQLLERQLKDFEKCWRRLNSAIELSHLTKNELLHELARAIRQTDDYFTSAENVEYALKEQTNILHIILRQLQDKFQEMRLVPIGSILQPMVRYVRDVSRELNKEVSLNIIGEDIEIDRAVLFYVKDPLMHILRNAVDHGIENSTKRIEFGKPKMGSINIEVTAKSGQILLEIQDDGAGIDIEEIKLKAIQKNIITADKAEIMSDDEILDCVFYPGFSTKQMVTDISGRGVGMDVVQTNIQRVKGDVLLKSKMGLGTKVSLILPLTLSADRGTWIKCNDDTMIVPTNTIKHILRIAPEMIHTIDNAPMISYQDKSIPLFYFSDVLGMPRQDSDKTDFYSVIVLSRGRHLAGFIVDAVLEESEIIIKPILPPLEQLPCVTGATLTDKGDVVLVLNTTYLMEVAFTHHFHQQIDTQHTEKHVYKPLHILVVDDSITTRTMEMNMLEGHGYDVDAVANGDEAWHKLQHEPFDLVVSDIDMPKMNGFELTEHIKHDKRFSHIPVIMVTSMSSEADRKHGLEVGADAYVVKSQYESGVLINVIEDLRGRSVKQSH